MFSIQDIIKNSVDKLADNIGSVNTPTEQGTNESTLEQKVAQDISNAQQKQETQAGQSINIPIPQGYIPYKNTYTTSQKVIQGQDIDNTSKSITTDYNTDKANREAEAERERYRQLLQPYKEQQTQYLQSLNDIYNRFSPDKSIPLRKDERLAGIQALATALGDLGRAVGRSMGNDKGLGMVEVDKDKNFQDFYKRLLTAQDQVRQQEAEEGLRQLNQQIALLKGQNDIDGKILSQVIDAGEKARERALQGNKTVAGQEITDTNGVKNTIEQSNSYIDPKSLTTKTPSSSRSSSSSSSSRSSYSKGKGGKANYWQSPYWRAGGQNSFGLATSEREGGFSDTWKTFMSNGDIELTDEDVGKYYGALSEIMQDYLATTDENGKKKYTIKRTTTEQLKDMNKLTQVLRQLCASWNEASKETDKAYYRKSAMKLFNRIDDALNRVNFKSDFGL